MSDVVIQKMQTKPERIDVVIIRDDNIEEIAALLECTSYSVIKELATGKKRVEFTFDSDRHRRPDFRVQIGDILAKRVHEENARWDWAPVGFFATLDPLNENILTVADIRDFAPPYDN